MIVLGLDTATPASVVGLTIADGTTLQARDDPKPGERPGHATRLLPLASELLVQAGLEWGRVERVAVGIGPGTFTGLRIGAATARGLAQSLGVPLVGVSSLRALAAGAGGRVEEGAGLLAVIDARRGEMFVAGYDGEMQVLAARALSPADAAGALSGLSARIGTERWIAVGDGAVLYRDALEAAGVTIPHDRSELHLIQARALCELGAEAEIPEAPVVPDYRRRPDAEIALEGATRG